jgi:hypothetical protein
MTHALSSLPAEEIIDYENPTIPEPPSVPIIAVNEFDKAVNTQLVDTNRTIWGLFAIDQVASHEIMNTYLYILESGKFEILLDDMEWNTYCAKTKVWHFSIATLARIFLLKKLRLEIRNLPLENKQELDKNILRALALTLQQMESIQ